MFQSLDSLLRWGSGGCRAQEVAEYVRRAFSAERALEFVAKGAPVFCLQFLGVLGCFLSHLGKISFKCGYVSAFSTGCQERVEQRKGAQDMGRQIGWQE